MEKAWTLIVFFLIPVFNIYSQIYFSQQIIINYTSGSGAASVYAADLDGDGDKDVLSASRSNNKIAWYKNIDGKGTFGPLQLISSGVDSPESVYPADLDGDGDMDVLSASRNDNKIAWYANTDGKGTFGPQQVISSVADAPYSVFASDIDGDGDMDVLSASYADDKIAWFKNTDGKGTFSAQQVISKVADGAVCVYASDLDGDGDMDVLSASIYDDKIAWYENTDGKGAFSNQQVITTETRAPWSVSASDIDGDGDKDVLSASYTDNKIAWYANTDGKGTFGPQKVITTEAGGANSVHASDLDGDGDMDVLSASSADNKIAWYRNREKIKWDEEILFVEHLVDADFYYSRSVYCADMDGDGDLDVLGSKEYPTEIALWENLDVGSGSFYKHSIDTIDKKATIIIKAADIDGDKDMDVICGKSGGIEWYENTGSFTFTKHIIDGDFLYSNSVFAADMDHDGDLDILGASYYYNDIAWWKNDGSGNFTKYIIDASFSSANSIYAIDMDGDHDMDVVGLGSSQTAWWENDGTQKFTKHIIAENFYNGGCVIAIDLDSDTDVDVLCADAYRSEIVMWENNGSQSFTKDTIDAKIGTGSPNSIYTTDIDNDRDEDILAASSFDDGKVYLYENLGAKNFFKLIVDHIYYGANSVYAADLDNDGDKDIIGASMYSKNIFWWENTLLKNPNPIASDIIVSPDTLFFYVGPGEQKNEDELVYTIKNTGNATLYVQDISCQKKWITDIDTLNFLVKQGKEQQVTIKCSAADLYNGIYNGNLEIHSNDPDTPVLNLPMVLEMRKGLNVNFVNEIEPNNRVSQAQKLFGPSPSGIRGTISVSDVEGKIGTGDFIEDLYVFTILSSGIKIKLYDFSADLNLYLMKIVGNTTTWWSSNNIGSTLSEEFEKTDLEPGTYYIGVSIYDTNPIQNSSSYSLVLEGNLITGVKEYTNLITQEFSLGQNYPNPFNPFTKIDFQVQKPARITITIYDSIGREVRMLVDNFYQTGNYTATWDGLDNNGQKVNAGVYFYCMKSIDFKEVKKALLLK